MATSNFKRRRAQDSDWEFSKVVVKISSDHIFILKEYFSIICITDGEL